MTVEVPRLVQRLRERYSSTDVQGSRKSILEPSQNRESLDSPPPASQVTPPREKMLTRRTGWWFEWDVKRSQITVKEAEGGPIWSQNVGALPPNVSAQI